MPEGSGSALITILIGLSSGGGLIAVVAAWRQYKSGKIGDADKVIERYDQENKRLEDRAVQAEAQRDEALKRMWLWQEQAMQYRFQIMGLATQPADIPALWSGVISNEQSRSNAGERPAHDH